MGAKLHPYSGSKTIKQDASTREELIEIKDANKTHSLNAEELKVQYIRAVTQGKDAIYIVYFANGIVGTMHITKQ